MIVHNTTALRQASPLLGMSYSQIAAVQRTGTSISMAGSMRLSSSKNTHVRHPTALFNVMVNHIKEDMTSIHPIQGWAIAATL